MILAVSLIYIFFIILYFSCVSWANKNRKRVKMGKFQTFQEFLTTTSVKIPVFSFTINLLLAALLSFLLGWVYVRYGSALSNRKLFSRNFLLMTMITMLIISIVKSSLALSLGLVGALSIVRFRAAIKEPEELLYLFFAIAIGLGLGADQMVITIIAFIIIIGILIIRRKVSYGEDNQNLHLTIHSNGPQKIELEQIVDVLQKTCLGVNLKRFDETNKFIEASFLIEFHNFEQLNEAKNALQKLNDSIKINFLDNKGIM